jgi:phage tail sheath protein FI
VALNRYIARRIDEQDIVVKCDAATTTQADIERGVVNIVIGFAPEKPAEFVVITIARLAATGTEHRG